MFASFDPTIILLSPVRYPVLPAAVDAGFVADLQGEMGRVSEETATTRTKIADLHATYASRHRRQKEESVEAAKAARAGGDRGKGVLVLAGVSRAFQNVPRGGSERFGARVLAMGHCFAIRRGGGRGTTHTNEVRGSAVAGGSFWWWRGSACPKKFPALPPLTQRLLNSATVPSADTASA
jgi:hypothetical protein